MEEPTKGKLICLITPGHISSNPRLVKEAIALLEDGYKVHINFTQYLRELVVYDEAILMKYPNITTSVLNWSGSGLKSKWNKLKAASTSRFAKDEHTLINRNFRWQLHQAIKIKAQLYIAHNLGALPIAVLAAEKNKAKSGFDAEDFHRYEATNDDNDPTVILKKSIEDRFLKRTDYLTAASYMISAKYHSLYKKKIETILNVFPKTNFDQDYSQNNALKLFWFSQTIGEERGIELIFEALSLCDCKPELHLLGKISDEYLSKVKILATQLNINSQLFIHATVAPDQVLPIAAAYDIGLAAENTSPLNRNICLTNKLFTYIQSGLVVLASNTDAQRLFISDYQSIGKVYSNASQLAEMIMFYDKNRQALSATKASNYELGLSSLNWETESKKFLAVIHKIIE